MKLKDMMIILQALIDSGAAAEDEEVEVVIPSGDVMCCEEYFGVYGVTLYNNGSITLKANSKE